MEGPSMAALAATWVALGGIVFVCAVRARRSPSALRRGRLALGVLFLLAGAAVNAAFLATGTDYAAFADASYLAFVRDTWRSVVAPNQVLFIGLLVVFEAVAGVLVLAGGRRAQVGMLAMIGFHAALLSFGWGFYAWSVPMLIALLLLLRAQRDHDRRTAPDEREQPGSRTGGSRVFASPTLR